MKKNYNKQLGISDLNGRCCLLIKFSVNYKSYLPWLNSEENKFLKNLHCDLYISMHQIKKMIHKIS